MLRYPIRKIINHKLSADLLEKWVLPVLIVFCAILSATWYLVNAEPGIPMADSYIHFSYARNLVLYQELSFNPGASEGIGSTSFLWVLVLAAFQVLGIPPEISSVVVGSILLVASGMLVFDLCNLTFVAWPRTRKLAAATIAALCTVMPGSLVWLALSGMEAILFLCLSLLGIKAYANKHWALLGVLLGTLFLTRIEGLLLAGVIGLIDVIRQRRISKGLILTAVITLLFVMPWLIYLYNREGILATASYQGRQVMVQESNSRISSQPILEWLIAINPVVYVFCWTAFLLLYASGAAGLPGPVWEPEGSLLGTQIEFPYLGWVLVVIGILPLLVLALVYLWRRRTRLRLAEPGHQIQAVVLLWVAVHNLAYAIFISQIGAAGRYTPMNHILFWIFLFLGADSIKNTAHRYISYSYTGLILLMSLVYWQQVYAANIDYNQQVKVEAARYVAGNIPNDSPVGATDLGPIRYFSQQPVIDLIGHVNKEVGPFREAGGDFADYVHEKKICYLLLYSTVDEEGIDFAEEMGLKDDPRFLLASQARFEIQVDTWRMGSEPVRNYMPAVEVYQVSWKGPDRCDQESETE